MHIINMDNIYYSIYKLYKVKGQKNTFPANGKDKKVGIGILIASKMNFKRNVIRKDQERECVMIKGFICMCAC